MNDDQRDDTADMYVPDDGLRTARGVVLAALGSALFWCVVFGCYWLATR